MPSPIHTNTICQPRKTTNTPTKIHLHNSCPLFHRIRGMVAQSRKSAPGRSRSPSKRTSARSPSPSNIASNKKTSLVNNPGINNPPTSSTSSGVFGVIVLVLLASTMAIVNSNISGGLLSDGKSSVEWMGFSVRQVDSFFSALAMILASEVGDKTFFIAAVLAMKHSRAVVLVGALGALALMTVLSAILGDITKRIMPHEYTHYLAVLLFIVFGIKLLKDAQEMEPEGPSEELEEVEKELSKTDKKKDSDLDPENGSRKKNVPLSLVNAVVWQAFSLTFVAEWGDRSQVSTIALSAQKDALAVTLGGVLGHACCTSLAVIGGRMLASRISERTVTMSGGALFLIFAVHGMLQDPRSPHND